MNAFQSQQVDVITLDRTNLDGLQWKVRYNFKKKYVSNEFEFVAFNLSNKILKEREVRTAIAYAVDREQIISSILPGEAVASDLPVIPDTWLNDTNVVSYERDCGKGKADTFRCRMERKQRYIFTKESTVLTLRFHWSLW